MSHVGRPYDKKTNTLTVKQDEAVDAIVGYLQRKLRIKFAIPKFHIFEKEGIHDIDTSINWLIQDLRARKIGGIYLPNTRWFAVSPPRFILDLPADSTCLLRLSPSRSICRIPNVKNCALKLPRYKHILGKKPLTTVRF